MSLPSFLAFLLPSSSLHPWFSHIWSTVLSLLLQPLFFSCLGPALQSSSQALPLPLCLPPCLLGCPHISQYSVTHPYHPHASTLLLYYPKPCLPF